MAAFQGAVLMRVATKSENVSEVWLCRSRYLQFDLIGATQNPDWYKPIRGIGPKSADDIERKLDQRYIQKLTDPGDEVKGKLCFDKYYRRPVGNG